MADSTILNLDLQTTGSNSGTWGTVTNENLQKLEQAIKGYVSLSVAGNGTQANSGKTSNMITNEDGEIFWRSPDGKWNATGYTDFDDVQRAGIGYNTDKLNINYNTDFGGNEYLRGQWNPTDYTSIGGSTNFGKDQNIYAGVNYPIDKNWVVDALYRHTANQDEDENRIMFGLRGNW